MKKCFLLILILVLVFYSVSVCGETFGNLEYKRNDRSITITGCSSSIITSVTIPSLIEGLPVTSIQSDAFRYCTNLTSITIPNSVTTIGAWVFFGCSSLTSVTIPASVTYIGNGTFDGCPAKRYCTINTDGSKALSKAGYSFVDPQYPGFYLRYSYSGDDITGLAVVGADANITEAVIPDGITSIGYQAFYNCSNLVSITIPNSVTSIDTSAFSNCSSLDSVTIPDSVVSIGSAAFYNCSNLASIVIPERVTAIGAQAFGGCSNLTTVTIPDGVTSIGNYAFRDCTSLKSVIIRGGITKIAQGTFQGCSSLTGIMLPSTVTEIGPEAFSGTSISNLSLNNVVTIGSGAFRNCLNLTYISLTPVISSIADDAFTGSALKDVDLPESLAVSLTSLPFKDTVTYNSYYVPSVPVDEALDAGYKVVSPMGGYINKADGLYTASTNSAAYIFGYSGNETELTLPEKPENIEYYHFLTNYWHSQNTTVTSITLPSTLDSIYSLSNFAALTDIYLPDTIRLNATDLPQGYTYHAKAGSETANKLTAAGIEFVDTTETVADFEYEIYNGQVTLIKYTGSSTEVTIPSTIQGYPVATIGSGLFEDCADVTSVMIPKSAIQIGPYAFSDCIKLSSIHIPDSVEYIGNHAFEGCQSLSSIKLPASLTSIENNLFHNCSALSSITIPDSVTAIMFQAFWECSSLASISIPNSVTSIQFRAFEGCSSLSSINIPPSVTSIDAYTFYNCISLSSISIPSSVTSINEYAFSNCSLLSSVEIPKGLPIIGEYAFYDCKSLFSIEIPDSVISIGRGAFCRSGLSFISIPSSVVSIGDDAFNYIESLEKIYLPDSVTSFGSSPFPTTTILYCHEYSEADYWAQENGYPNIVYVNGDDLDQNRSIKLFTGDLALPRGQSETISLQVFPDFDHPEVTWTTSDPTVATVENGTVTVTGRGTATITASVGSASASLTVTGFIAPESFDLIEEEWVLTKGTLQLSITNLNPADSDAVFEWSSADTGIATVNADGLVTAKRPGAVAITATTNGISRDCLVHVVYPVTAVSFDDTEISVRAGEETQLTAHVTARDETFDNRLITFSSSDETVAIIDETGLVHALKAGTATITATAESGVSSSIECVVPPCDVHTEVIDPAVNPTCTETGLTQGIHCSVCGTVITPQETVPALGHDWHDATYTWAEDNSTVTATHICKRDETHTETEMATMTATVTKPATCEELGETTYSASFTNEAFAAQSKTLADIPAAGHDWGEVTYTWAEDNKSITASRVCKHDETHTETETANVTTEVTKPATCEVAGETTYSATFTNAAFEAQSKTLSDIPATGHDWSEVTYVWTDDNQSVTASRVCKHDATHTETETATVTTTVTQPATCEVAGETTYSAAFSNEAFAPQNKTLADITAIGHDWNAATYIWADDNKTVTATRICKHDESHTETETAAVTTTVTKPATCEEAGETTYSVTFANEAFAPQSKTLADIPATGHDWNEATYTWADDNTTVTASRICKHDETHTETETAAVIAKITKAATCEEAGETTYSASFSNEAFAPQSKTLADIPATGHDWNVGPGRLPTAEAPGYTAGSTCLVCGKQLADHQTVESVQTLTLPAALKAIHAKAFEKTAADYVLLPAGTTAIGSRAFADSPNLRFITVPDSVTDIAPDAFEGCQLVTFFCSDSSAAAEYAESHGFAHAAP